MLGTKTRELLDRARGPLGPKVAVDFGSEHAPLRELAELLSEMNGFFAFNAGVQIFHAGGAGVGPELSYWNSSEAWKGAYDGLANDFFCFGQDVLGMQFAIKSGSEVVRFDPENARSYPIGDSLEAWASWLLSKPNINATATLAKVWQDRKGALEPNERLIPLKFFELGGEVSLENLMVKDSVEAMRARGPIAVQIHDLPPGTEVHLKP
jgi:hypothetical protein